MFVSFVLPVKRVLINAVLPTRGSAHAAGYDLSIPMNLPETECDWIWIHPGERRLIDIGISVAIPLGYYGRVAPRSGLANKHGLDVLAGVIDADYRGSIGVILLNTGRMAVKLTNGDRIAQLIIEKIATPEVVEVTSLEPAVRGEGGFGSTGR